MDKLIVKEVIGSASASSPNKAKLLLNTLRDAVASKRTTSIDFSGLSIITTAFMNTSIGRLYSLYDVNELDKYIRLDTSSLPPLQKERIQLVIENAKQRLSKEKIAEEIESTVTIH